MLSKAQQAALLEIQVLEKALSDYIKGCTRRFFPRSDEELLQKVCFKLDRIRSAYQSYELDADRFRVTAQKIYDLLLRKKRFHEAAEVASKYSL